MSGPTMVSEDIGGSPLSRAARSGGLPEGWTPSAPGNATEWAAAAKAVGLEFAGRSWYSALEPAIKPRGAAATRLARAAEQGGVLVTTGQQPGLFGGHLLTIVKAISARALADRIERATGIAAAPLFWAATDDADFDEASLIAIATRDGVIPLRSDHRPPAGTPMARAILGDVTQQAHALREACGSVADPAMLDLLADTYRADATVGDAYVQLLRAVLEPLEIAVLDASHPSVRIAGGGVMRRALECAPEIARAGHRRIEAIRAAGFEPQVEEMPELSLVFAHEDGKKRRLTIAESASAAGSLPAEVLSPTVLLRPVLERAILPTVSYVAGPGELAYFTQVSPLAECLGVPAPLAVPRWSVTIVEPRIQKVLTRLESSPTEIRDPDKVATRLAKARTPAALTGALSDLRRLIDSGVTSLAAADETNLLPPRAIEGIRTGLLAELAHGERRVEAAVKRRDETLGRDIRVAHAALFPGGVMQERVLSWIPYLVRYGTPLLDEMLEAALEHADQLLGAR